MKKIETFFFNYKHDIWPSAVSILIANTIDPEGHKAIQKYLNYVIEKAYSENLKDCNFIAREFEDYLLGKETDNISDCYAFLRKQTDKKMIRYCKCLSWERYIFRNKLGEQQSGSDIRIRRRF